MASDRAGSAGPGRYPRVPLGAGVLHGQRPQYSPETQQLLRVLMAESRLTTLQRRQLGESLSRGSALPAKPLPAHGTAAPPAPEPPHAARLGSRRPRHQIVQSGAYDRELFVPAHPRVDKQREKHVFQDRMSFGKEMPPTPRRKAGVRRAGSRSPQPEPERFDELSHEINERVQFLKDMDNLGHGHKYYPVIRQQIATKLREMEKIDKEKCQEMKDLMSSEQRMGR